MASYRKTKHGWRVEICINRVRDSGTFDTKAAARAWADQREEQIRSGKAPGDDTRTVADIFDRYAREVSIKKRGRRWEEVRLLKLSRDPLAAVRLSALTKYDLIAWRDRQTISAGSILREMNLLNHAFFMAFDEWQWLTHNPMEGVKRPPPPQARTRRPSPDEIDRIVLALGWWEGCQIKEHMQRVAVAYLFAIETGMRAGEICSLIPEHVDLKARVAHLPMTKNGLARDVPLSKRAIQLLKQLQPWGETVFRVGVKTLDVLFRRARDACKIENLTFHDSRREAASRLSKKLHPLELARVLGHTDLDMLLVYYQENASEIAKKL
jgi:integrase